MIFIMFMGERVRLSEDDEVLAESKKPVVFPSKRGTSKGINIPSENLEKWTRNKPIRQCLVKVFTMRGKDGIPYLVIKRVKIQ